MSTIAIVSDAKENDAPTYLAAAGTCHAVGETAGQALDALTTQFPEVDSGSLIVVQCFRPDRHFSADRQQRLQQLMQSWRQARDSGQSLTTEEQTELERLVEEEIQASGRRAADAAEGLGR